MLFNNVDSHDVQNDPDQTKHHVTRSDGSFHGHGFPVGHMFQYQRVQFIA